MNFDPVFEEHEQVSKPLFSLALRGSGLVSATTPIYELGNILVATQLMIHKVYKVNRGRPVATHLTSKERNELALQIGGREKGSDILHLISYGLEYLTTDPFAAAVTAGVLSPAITGFFNAAKSYATQTAKDDVVNDETNPDHAATVLATFPEMKAIARQLQRDNGVNELTLYRTDDKNDTETVKMDPSLSLYLREIGSTEISGRETNVSGRIHQFNESDRSMVLLYGAGHKLRIELSQGDYIETRKKAGLDAHITCHGRFRTRFEKQRRFFVASQITVH